MLFLVVLTPCGHCRVFEYVSKLGEKVEDFILLEGGDDNKFYLQQETDDLLVTNLIPLY